jgi:hypothetical protein
MADREHFVASIQNDLAALEENPLPPSRPQTGDPWERKNIPGTWEHRTEYGL